jgi:hypothetical protein
MLRNVLPFCSFAGQELAILSGHPEEIYHVEFLSSNKQPHGQVR